LVGLHIIQYGITYKEYDGRYSYTFATYRDIPNEYLENIIIEIQEDGTYGEYLIQYEMSDQEITALSIGEIVPLENRNIIFTSLEGINFGNIMNRGTSDSCYTIEWSTPIEWCSEADMSPQDAFNLGVYCGEIVALYNVT